MFIRALRSKVNLPNCARTHSWRQLVRRPQTCAPAACLPWAPINHYADSSPHFSAPTEASRPTCLRPRRAKFHLERLLEAPSKRTLLAKSGLERSELGPIFILASRSLRLHFSSRLAGLQLAARNLQLRSTFQPNSDASSTANANSAPAKTLPPSPPNLCRPISHSSDNNRPEFQPQRAGHSAGFKRRQTGPVGSLLSPRSDWIRSSRAAEFNSLQLSRQRFQWSQTWAWIRSTLVRFGLI